MSITETLCLIVVVALANTAAHWAPWHLLPGTVDPSGRPRRLIAYTFGTTTILAGAILAAVIATETGAHEIHIWTAVGTLTALVVAAGIGTSIPYLIDALTELAALRGDLNDYEQTNPR